MSTKQFDLIQNLRSSFCANNAHCRQYAPAEMQRGWLTNLDKPESKQNRSVL